MATKDEVRGLVGMLVMDPDIRKKFITDFKATMEELGIALTEEDFTALSEIDLDGFKKDFEDAANLRGQCNLHSCALKFW